MNTAGWLLQNVKNLPGWRTKRKIVVFSVDDYGNVRVDSKRARLKMDQAGIRPQNHFDQFDSLEDEDDFTHLFETLSSVKDVNARCPVFTAFALPANINFEKVIADGFENYSYELLPETYLKLRGYSGMLQLWRQGISERLIIPQFHGREHINIKFLQYLFRTRDKEMLACFNNRSYTGVSVRPFRNITFASSFSFEEFSENVFLESVVADGLEQFYKVFGFRAVHFTAPSMQEHTTLHRVLKDGGIQYIDAPMIKNEHQGLGAYKRRINFTGATNAHGQTMMVRNCVFEPLADASIDWVNYCLKQIEAAFRWNKPAIVSSHRVNFAGHVDPSNRSIGLKVLRKLLLEISRRWPEVEYMSAPELGGLIDQK